MTFTLSLKAARINAKLTQKQMAQIVGVSILTISNWETGKTEPTMSQLRTFAKACHVPSDNLEIASGKAKI